MCTWVVVVKEQWEKQNSFERCQEQWVLGRGPVVYFYFYLSLFPKCFTLMLMHLINYYHETCGSNMQMQAKQRETQTSPCPKCCFSVGTYKYNIANLLLLYWLLLWELKKRRGHFGKLYFPTAISILKPIYGNISKYFREDHWKYKDCSLFILIEKWLEFWNGYRVN